MTIDIDLYRTRRARVLDAIAARGGGVAIQPTAPEVLRNRDSEFPHRHDGCFHCLIGFPEPEAVVAPDGREVLTHEAVRRPEDIEALMRG
jgi:Xaa-Pro aminopeptidase